MSKKFTIVVYFTIVRCYRQRFQGWLTYTCKYLFEVHTTTISTLLSSTVLCRRQIFFETNVQKVLFFALRTVWPPGGLMTYKCAAILKGLRTSSSKRWSWRGNCFERVIIKTVSRAKQLDAQTIYIPPAECTWKIWLLYGHRPCPVATRHQLGRFVSWLAVSVLSSCSLSNAACLRGISDTFCLGSSKSYLL